MNGGNTNSGIGNNQGGGPNGSNVSNVVIPSQAPINSPHNTPYLHNIPDLERIFTEEQVLLFRRTFDSITYGRQVPFIRVDELGEAMRSLGFSPDEMEIQDCLEELKIPKKNFCLSFEHFMHIMARKFNDVQIRNVFRVFDQDGDGVISLNELKSVLLRLGERLSEDDLREMMQEADVDGDELLNFDDFSKIMRA